jgi:DNA polymerase III subunit delta
VLYIFWGEDEYSREEALQEIKKSLGDPAMLSTNTTVLEGQKLTINELKAAAESMPFLSPARLVIVKGLLERFEPKPKTETRKNGASPAANQAAPFINCLRNLPPSTVLVLTDNVEVKKPFLQSNSVFTAIADKAEVRSFPNLRGTKLAQWIEARINRQGGSISRQATNILMETGGDLFILSNEIQKLVAFTGGRLIEEKDVRGVVSASQEADIFVLIDTVIDRQVGKAEQILQKLLQNGVMPPQILVLIARQVRILIQIKQLRSLKKPLAEIQTQVGIFSPFIWEKTARRADKYTLERLKEIYRSLLNTDLAIKTGKYEGDLALDVLVAELCLS